MSVAWEEKGSKHWALAHSKIKRSGRKRGTSKGVLGGEACEIVGKLGECGMLQVKFLKSGTRRRDQILLIYQVWGLRTIGGHGDLDKSSFSGMVRAKVWLKGIQERRDDEESETVLETTISRKGEKWSSNGKAKWSQELFLFSNGRINMVLYWWKGSRKLENVCDAEKIGKNCWSEVFE